MNKLLPIKAIMGGMLLSLVPLTANAQLSKNPDKFLGNITTRYNMDYGNEKYYTLWNQVTCENESKWASIEGSRGNYNFGGSDNAYNYAKRYNFPFKFHALTWGAQFPGWLESLSVEERYKAIVQWFDAVKKHYPQLDMIDVTNEAVQGHQPKTGVIAEALGGGGVTGYDWIIKAFEMAYERWPDAILIYNDYNTFQWNTDQFIDLVTALRDAGAPVDAYGCQSHDLTDCDATKFKNAMVKIQNALKMPMYSTEYDIGTSDDALQLRRYQEQIPYMWEADYCAGITLWGYIYGATWTTDGNSGIIRDGKDRPAMTWLREYMKSEKALNAKSPFPGMKKEASLYVKPAAPKVAKNDSIPITVRLQMRTKTVDHVDLYVKGKLYATLTEAPYVAYYKPILTGKHDLKAIVYTTDGSTYERLASFTVGNPRVIYNGGGELPGTIQGENFDGGTEGITFHDSDTRNTGDARTYRPINVGGVDMVKTADGGFALGETAAGEWVEYSVNVKEAGLYSFDAFASAAGYDASFKLTLSSYDIQTDLTGEVRVPCTQVGNWENYIPVHGRMLVPLKEGKQIIRLNVLNGNFRLDSINFQPVTVDEDIKISVRTTNASVKIGDSTTIKATITPAANSIKEVRFYANGEHIKTITQEPYETIYAPAERGTTTVSAIAVDVAGNESKIATYKVVIKNVRTPFKETLMIPGIIEAEDFDKGGEGLSFHDSDNKDEDNVQYRFDNEGVDIVKGNGGHAIGYTKKGEWLLYSVNINESANYSFAATVSSGVEGSSFTISLVRGSIISKIATVEVPKTGNNTWTTYRVVEGNLTRKLFAGANTIRIDITGDQCNIDKIEFKNIDDTAIGTINVDNPVKAKSIYNISGQRLNGLQKGINIIDGKKVYIR